MEYTEKKKESAKSAIWPTFGLIKDMVGNDFFKLPDQ